MGCIASQTSELDWAPPPPFPVPVDFHAALVFLCVFFLSKQPLKSQLCGDVMSSGRVERHLLVELNHLTGCLLLGVCCRCACLSPSVPGLSTCSLGAVRLSISLNCHCSLVGVCSHEKGGLPTGSTWVRVGGRIVPFPGMKVKSFPCSLSPEGNLEDMQETLVNVHERGSHQHSQCGSCEK